MKYNIKAQKLNSSTYKNNLKNRTLQPINILVNPIKTVYGTIGKQRKLTLKNRKIEVEKELAWPLLQLK